MHFISNIKDARVRFEEALYVAEFFKETLYQAIILNELGEVAIEKLEYPIAIAYFRDAKAKANQIENKSNLARSIIGRSKCYENDKAEKFRYF